MCRAELALACHRKDERAGTPLLENESNMIYKVHKEVKELHLLNYTKHSRWSPASL